MKTTKPLRSCKSTCLRVALGVAITALLAGSPTDAGVKNWLGTVNGNWNTPGNWVENAVPTNGDQLVFSAATRYTITNNITNLRLDRITFSNGGYLVRGNGVTLTNGLVSAPPAAAAGNQLEIDVTLGASQTFRCDRTNLYFAGAISLGANTLTVTNPAGTEVLIGEWAGTGLISGTGGITKDGAGTLSFAGWSVANTYTGPTYVKNGTLLLSRVSVPAIPGPGTLTIGDGSGSAGSAVVRYGAADQIGSVPVVLNPDGLLDLAGNSDTIDAAVTLAGGDITLGAGTLTLGGNVTVSSSDSVINGPTGAVNLPATRTFDVASGVFFDLQAPVTGAGGINKAGTGILRLGYPNTYAGLTVVQAGFLEMWTGLALGGTSSGTVVSNGATVQFRGNLTVTNEAVTLNGSGVPGYGALRMWQSGTSYWTGPITLASDSVIKIDHANGIVAITNVINGAGGVTKTGSGTLQFSGPGLIYYYGDTYVNEGTLLLYKSPPVGIYAGTLTIGDGIGGSKADVVRCLAGGQINPSVPVIIKSSGLLDLNGWSSGVAALTLDSGAVETGTGTLGLSGDVVAFKSVSTNADPYIIGNLSLGSSTRTFTVSNNVYFKVDAAVAGTGGIVKTGGGTMRLGSPNTYSGLTVVQQGFLEPSTALSLGATSNGTVVSNGATLTFWEAVAVTNEALVLNGPGPADYGALDSAANGTNIWAGPITLNGDSTIEPYAANTTWRIIGPISGPGGLTKLGSGALVLEGDNANTYAGSTYVNSGELRLGKTGVDQAIPGNLVISGTVRLLADDQINNSAHVTINSSGSLHLNFYSEGIGSLSGSGFLEVGYAGLDVGYNNASTIFSGTIAGAPGSMTQGLRKSAGSGTLTLTGTNTYTGFTEVDSGTLLINGYQPQSPVYVTAGGTLGGTGTVGSVKIQSGGSFRPGTSPGILTSSNLTMDVSSHYYIELNGITPGAGYDQVNVRGTVGLTNPVLHATLGFPSAIGNSFTIINNDGFDAVSGTFSGLPEGATVNVSGTPFRITYAGGTGNDVVLTQLTAQQRPRLQIARAAGTNVVLWWPTNFEGYYPEAKTNITNTVWSEVSGSWAVVGTNYFVTNPASGSLRYYRLRLP